MDFRSFPFKLKIIKFEKIASSKKPEFFLIFLFFMTKYVLILSKIASYVKFIYKKKKLYAQIRSIFGKINSKPSF